MDIKNKRIISWDAEQRILVFEVDGTRYRVMFLPSQDSHKKIVYFFGEQQLVTLDVTPGKIQLSEEKKLIHPVFKPQLLSPLDGMVVAVNVVVGQQVNKNDSLVVIEAMKMENILHAPHDAIIKNLFIGVGSVVHQHQVLMVFEEKGENEHARTNHKHE